jgi:hypothetical protein
MLDLGTTGNNGKQYFFSRKKCQYSNVISVSVKGAYILNFWWKTIKAYTENKRKKPSSDIYYSFILYKQIFNFIIFVIYEEHSGPMNKLLQTTREKFCDPDLHNCISN